MDPKPIRIATIAGRFLVFDPDAVASLRRSANTNGTLVGTAPQQPTQNIFLGLPIELRPEEAHALVAQGAAFIVDDVAAHAAVLGPPQRSGRGGGGGGGNGDDAGSGDEGVGLRNEGNHEAYLASLRRHKLAAHKVYIEKNAKRASQAAAARHMPSDAASPLAPTTTTTPITATISATTAAPAAAAAAAAVAGPSIAAKNHVNSLAVTPTCSSDLVPADACLVAPRDAASPLSPQPGPLCGFLQRAGYFMTPGLRFGAKYSVYPGDPLRYHAHFMANQYAWEEDIPILDIVGGGRLATAVKKAFLLGGEQPARADGAEAKPAVRTFSIEWAGM